MKINLLRKFYYPLDFNLIRFFKHLTLALIGLHLFVATFSAKALEKDGVYSIISSQQLTIAKQDNRLHFSHKANEDGLSGVLQGNYKIIVDAANYTKASFTSGFFDGVFESVKNGKLSYYVDYCMGKPCGVYRSYFKSGKLSSNKNYNQQSLLDGDFRAYSAFDGRILRKSHYRNGLKEGGETLFFEKGKEGISTRSNYRRGEKDGLEVVYFQDGGVEIRQHYKAGELHGPYTKYNREGAEEYLAYYQNGAYHGSVKMFLDGNLWIEKHYQYGKLHGKWIEYDTQQRNVAVTVRYFRDDAEVPQYGWTDKSK